MALLEDFEKTGNWLFRWRSYLPLVMIGLVLLALREYRYPGDSHYLDHLWEGFCLLVSYLGLGIRIFAIGYAADGTSGRNTKKHVADTLNTTGAYSVVRNPLYVGNFFMGLGIALFAHLWWLTLIYVLLFWIYYERIIFAEEAYLRTKFGDTYLLWANARPVIVPDLRRYRRPRASFSLKRVLRREYGGFFAVILAFSVLEVVGDWITLKKVEIDPIWATFLGTGFVVWVVLRTLKKKTSLLSDNPKRKETRAGSVGLQAGGGDAPG
jgi:protein-S-isoprenylcysteine O-methyltransferase Ste14